MLRAFTLIVNPSRSAGPVSGVGRCWRQGQGEGRTGYSYIWYQNGRW